MNFNPFTPNFGQIPPHLAGRTKIITDVMQALEDVTGHPSQTSVLIGARGSGKTALLSYFSREAASRGWICVNVSCTTGIREDILLQARRAAEELLPKEPKHRLSGVSVGSLFSVAWEKADNQNSNWRTRVTSLLDALSAFDTGLLITIDEVTPRLDEMIEIASVYQLLLREEKKISLLMAGLPSEISSLLNNRSVSFLRRASQYYLGRIDDPDIEYAFVRTVEDAGRTIRPQALRDVVRAVDGFPYMMQLVGFRAWQQAEEHTCITEEMVANGIRYAEEDFKSRVLKATVQELSDGDIAFLRAMLPDEEISAISDIEKRMGKPSGYVSRYRARLLEEGVIDAAGRGRVRFALPGLKAYLKEVE